MRWRVLATLTLIGIAVGTSACMPLSGSIATPLDVPPALRSRVASEFPQFDLISAEGSTMSAPEPPGWTEQDVELLLRHKTALFYLGVQYDRNFKDGTTPPEWGFSNIGPNGYEGLDFRGRPDTRTASFIAHFVQEYPQGQMVMQDSGFSSDPGPKQKLEAWITRRDDGINGMGRTARFVYDPATNSWTGR